MLKFDPYCDELNDTLLDVKPTERTERDCYNKFSIILHYPSNAGNTQADTIIKNWIAEILQGVIDMENAILVTYELNWSGNRYLSVAFHQHIYPGGAHDDWRCSVLSFDLQNGRLLTLEDFFPDMRYSAPLLNLYVAKQLFPGRYEYITSHPTDGAWQYTSDAELLPYPLDMKAERLVITERGLQIIYSVYEQGAFVDGDRIVYIPLSDIKQLGGNTAFWEAQH